MAAGTLSASAADAIRVGLGAPTDSVSSTVLATVLATAAEHLCAEATTLDVNRLGILARQLRDEIDEAGFADREHARRTARSLRLFRRVDGVTRLVWVMVPEIAACVTDLYDRATSPAAADHDSSTVTAAAAAAATPAIIRPPRNAPPWLPETADACSPAVSDHHPGANATTSYSGPDTLAAPTYPTESFSAATTTAHQSAYTHAAAHSPNCSTRTG